mmetsp:Transcript_7760/g.17912  ORF Transcript_7760/g.17912 Transcript_7760/m.17912 type:complete len:242 (-) Transcript_7760:269-994(-)
MIIEFSLQRLQVLHFPLPEHVIHLTLAVDLCLLVTTDSKNYLRPLPHLLFIPPVFHNLEASSRILRFFLCRSLLLLSGRQLRGQSAAITLCLQKKHVVQGEEHRQLLQPLPQVFANSLSHLVGVLLEEHWPVQALGVSQRLHGAGDALQGEIRQVQVLVDGITLNRLPINDVRGSGRGEIHILLEELPQMREDLPLPVFICLLRTMIGLFSSTRAQPKLSASCILEAQPHLRPGVGFLVRC